MFADVFFDVFNIGLVHFGKILEVVGVFFLLFSNVTACVVVCIDFLLKLCVFSMIMSGRSLVVSITYLQVL